MIQMFQKKRLRAELARLVDLLGLGDWDVELEFVPAMDDRWAQVRSSPGCDEAWIDVGVDLLGQPWAKQQATLVHELLHVHHRDIEQYVIGQLDSLDITRQARELIWKGWCHQRELWTDRLEHALTPLVT